MPVTVSSIANEEREGLWHASGVVATSPKGIGKCALNAHHAKSVKCAGVVSICYKGIDRPCVPCVLVGSSADMNMNLMSLDDVSMLSCSCYFKRCRCTKVRYAGS